MTRPRLRFLPFSILALASALASVSPAAATAPVSLLHDNGPIVTHPGGGCGGSDASRLQDITLALGFYGFTASTATGHRLAEDFLVNGERWDLETAALLAYQHDGTTTSTITASYAQVWDGWPGAAGSTVVCGDLTTNRMLTTEFSGIYRDAESAPGSCTRPLMRQVLDLGGCVLAPGNYWIDWTFTGLPGDGPYHPPISVLGDPEPAHGLQYVPGAGWQSAIDLSSMTFQGFPLALTGISTPDLPFWGDFEEGDTSRWSVTQP